MRVLVVEDYEVLARSIGTGLRREGMAVDVVLDGSDALGHLAATRYDVVVLDRDLPGVHGDDVCRRIVAERSDSRVLMLTAASTVKDRVAGDVVLDPSRRVASRAGRRLELSPKEFSVLECLLASGDRVVSTEELLDRVWDEAADPFTTAVKTTIRRLRSKLGDPALIHTVREGGYRIGAS